MWKTFLGENGTKIHAGASFIYSVNSSELIQSTCVLHRLYDDARKWETRAWGWWLSADELVFYRR